MLKLLPSRKKALALAAALPLFLVAAGCTEDSAGTDEAAAAAVEEAPEGTFADNVADGSPVTIGLYVPEGGSAISQPESREAAQATVKYANKHLGGVGGHPIELKICKGKEDAASAADCANQFVESKVSAVVVTNTGQGDAMAPIITKAGIPYTSYSGASASELTSPNSFLWTGGFPAVLASMAKHAAAEGHEAVTLFVTDNAAALGGAKAMGEPAFEAAGVKLNIVPIPLGTPDTTPQVSAGLKNDPGAVGIVGDGTMCTSVLSSLQTLGSDVEKMVINYCLEPAVIEAVGNDGVDGSTVITSTDATSDDDEVVLYKAILGKYAPGTETAGNASAGYQSMMGLIRAAADVQGEGTAKDFVAALSKAKDVPLPLGAGLTFTCDGEQLPGMPAACSGSSITGTVEDGTVPHYEPVS